jgi:hypothetical protein
MPSDKKIKQFFRTALDRMFSIVGFDGFDEEFVKSDNWYLQREWTEEQEREYRNWLFEECRRVLKLTKKQAELEVGYFLLMWGWKTKYIEESTPNHEEHKVPEGI